MANKKWCVYKHTAPNGKVYIGITSQSPNRRWREGDGYKNNIYFYRAIQKYGWNNIRHEIIEKFLTEEQANLREIYYINQLNSNNPKYGYNIRNGGNAGKLSEETKSKLSNIAQNRTIEPRNVPIYMLDTNCNILREFISIKEAEKEIGIKAQHIYDSLCKLNNYANGYYWCRKEEYECYILNHKKHKEIIPQKVYMYDLDYNLLNEYQSISQASKESGVDKAAIQRVIKHKNFSANNLIFSISENLEEHINYFIDKKRKYRKVYQYDNETLIKIFNSPLEAAKSLNKRQSSCITNCCNGITKTAYGYVWKYAD